MSKILSSSSNQASELDMSNRVLERLEYHYYVDGGISPRLSPDPEFPCYGSYKQVIVRTYQGSTVPEMEFGNEVWFTHKNTIHTNNMSEFASFIHLLEVIKLQHKPEDWVCVIMDSEVVLHSIWGIKKIKDAKLIPLWEQAKALVDGCLFNLSFKWVSGKVMKTILSH